MKKIVLTISLAIVVCLILSTFVCCSYNTSEGACAVVVDAGALALPLSPAPTPEHFSLPSGFTAAEIEVKFSVKDYSFSVIGCYMFDTEIARFVFRVYQSELDYYKHYLQVSGYTFDGFSGWELAPQGLYYTANFVSLNDVSLDCIHTPLTYTVQFVDGMSGDVIQTLTASYGSTVTAPTPRPTEAAPDLADFELETLALTEGSAVTDWPAEADALPLGEIALYPAPDSDMLIYHFERGAVTLVTSDLTAPDSLGYSGHYETWDYPTSHLLYLGCNTAEGPCAGAAFRTALQSALNRETMAESLLSGHADASPLPFHPASALYDASLAEACAAPDPSALEGWAGTEVRLLVNAAASLKVALAEYAAATLEDAGLTVTVQSLSWPAFQAALEAGEYDLYLGEVRLEPNFDLSCLLAEDGSLNFSGYRSEAVSSALEAYLASGAQGRADAAAALSLAVCRESPILPLCFERHSILSNWGGLKAYTATQSNLFYHFTQWDLGNRIS